MMESSHEKPRSNHPPSINTPLNTTPTPKTVPLDSARLQTWVKAKLSIVPAMYSNYDEGMEAITKLVQQDFLPEYHSVAKQAFYKEFYTIGTESAKTGAELWSHWRLKKQKEVTESMGRHTSANSNAAESPSTARGKRVALDLLTEIGSSTDVTVGWQIRNSLILETEAKMLRNRDSNYWGDLAAPVWSQSAGKAKVVYIRPRSSRTTVGPANQINSIDSSARVGDLTKEYSKGYRRNSLPAAHASLVGDFGTVGGFIQDNPDLQGLQVPPGMINDTMDQKSNLTIVRSTEKAPHTQIAPLSFKISHRGNTHIVSASNAIVEDFHNQPNRPPPPHDATLASAADTFGMGVGTHLDSSAGEIPGSLYNQSERFSLGRHVTAGNSGVRTRPLQRTNRKITDFPGFRNASLSFEEDKAPVILRCDKGGFGVRWTNHGLPIQKVHQGHDILGLHSPAESLIASPSMTSPATENGRSYSQINSPTMIARSLSPVSLPTWAPSPSPIYSGSTGDSNDSEFDGNTQSKSALPLFHQTLPIGNLGVYSSKDKINQPLLPKTPDNSRTQMPLWQENPLPPLNQQKGSPHDQTVGNSVPVTRGNSGEDSRKVTFEKGTNRTPASSRAAQKQRNSMHPPGLRVTKEVIQEEEKDVGKFNRSTFTTHVPRFGKDPMKQIYKAHSKGDTKKHAFLRVIQDAVHDGIHIAKKAPPMTNNSEALKTLSNYPGKFVNKMSISGPIHDGNPLQLSSSKSTPNVLLNALPIPKATHGVSGLSQPQKMLPGTTLLNPHGKNSSSQAELLPWDDTTMGEDEFLSDGSEDMTQYRLKYPKPSCKAAVGPAITIDPFQQAALYSWIECSVVQACSDFLRQQQTSLDLDLLRKEVKKWRNEEIKFATGEIKKRDQPVEFMFGMEVQCRLVEGSHKALVFSGPSAMNPVAIITAWKNIIPSFSPRTFCFPDYLILEHLRVMEKVLHLFGPAYWDKKMYEKKRAEIVKRIMDSGKVRKTRSAEEKLERLQRERERAETQLLMEVGVLSTEGFAERAGETTARERKGRDAIADGSGGFVN